MTASARRRSRLRSTASSRSACSSSFGNASGSIEAFNINILQTKGSLFATRPTLNTYAAKREDLLAIANDLFDVVASGKVKIPVNQKYRAQGCAEGAPRSGGAQHHRLDDPDPVGAVDAPLSLGAITLRCRPRAGGTHTPCRRDASTMVVTPTCGCGHGAPPARGRRRKKLPHRASNQLRNPRERRMQLGILRQPRHADHVDRLRKARDRVDGLVEAAPPPRFR